ncbi:MAG: hypothetical protein QOF33_4309 [Thermomicrobiales bacterium]|jgi:hypothetical protein|nr:hypothetical protein [Thermomicrobiales bacterium]
MPKGEEVPGNVRKIQELAVRYRLNPEMRNEIWVEGSFDARMYRLFLNRHGRSDWTVFPIHTMNITKEVLEPLGMRVNDRNRVIHLSRTVCEKIGEGDLTAPIFIIDWDLEYLTDTDPIGCRLCLVTDVPSIEIYGIEPDSLQNLLTKYVNTDELTGQQIFDLIAPVLNECFLIRAALHSDGDGISMFDDVHQCCRREDLQLSLDIEEVIRLSIDRSRKPVKPTREEVRAKVEEKCAYLTPEKRQAIHKDDAATLLKMVVSELEIPKNLQHMDNFIRPIPHSLEIGELAKYPMFQELLRRTERSPGEPEPAA